jgi:hypothetical protein
MSKAMIFEGLSFLALALIYIAVSYGHSPGDINAGRQNDMDEETLRGEQRIPTTVGGAGKLSGGKAHGDSVK